MLNRTLTSTLAGSALALGLVFAGSASAFVNGLNDCSTKNAAGNPFVYGGAITSANAASLCQFLFPADNDLVANVTNVNSAIFFGYSTWEVAGANQEEPANGQAGSWSIPTPDFNGYNYMITFKDGKNTNLISFLFNEQYSSGGWITPFVNPPFGDVNTNQSKDVSHFTIFRTVDKVVPPAGEIPEPAALGLLGIGMLAMGMIRRRKTVQG